MRANLTALFSYYFVLAVMTPVLVGRAESVGMRTLAAIRKDFENLMENSALRYLALGWSVIPVRTRDKRPAVRWKQYQSAVASEKEVRNWFRRQPDANIAVVTGRISSLVVLDVDPRHGGADSLAAMESTHARLPHTIEAVTGSGGSHLYFRHPGFNMPNRARIKPGIDLRGDGGCVVVPPSLHPSGKRYAWKRSHRPGDTRAADMPAWLLELASAPPGSSGHLPEHWRGLVRAGANSGERNNTVASFAGYLLHQGLDPQVALELLRCWNALHCRPPLPNKELERTVGSITKMHRRQS